MVTRLIGGSSVTASVEDGEGENTPPSVLLFIVLLAILEIFVPLLCLREARLTSAELLFVDVKLLKFVDVKWLKFVDVKLLKFAKKLGETTDLFLGHSSSDSQIQID